MTAIPHAIGSHTHTHRDSQMGQTDMATTSSWCMYINNLMYCICNLINEPAKYTASGAARAGRGQRGGFSAWAKHLINIWTFCFGKQICIRQQQMMLIDVVNGKKKGNLTVLITRSCINKTFTNGFTRWRKGGRGDGEEGREKAATTEELSIHWERSSCLGESKMNGSWYCISNLTHTTWLTWLTDAGGRIDTRRLSIADWFCFLPAVLPKQFSFRSGKSCFSAAVNEKPIDRSSGSNFPPFSVGSTHSH